MFSTIFLYFERFGAAVDEYKFDLCWETEREISP